MGLLPADGVSDEERQAAIEADERMMAILHEKGEGLDWQTLRSPVALVIDVVTYFIALRWMSSASAR